MPAPGVRGGEKTKEGEGEEEEEEEKKMGPNDDYADQRMQDSEKAKGDSPFEMETEGDEEREDEGEDGDDEIDIKGQFIIP